MLFGLYCCTAWKRPLLSIPACQATVWSMEPLPTRKHGSLLNAVMADTAAPVNWCIHTFVSLMVQKCFNSCPRFAQETGYLKALLHCLIAWFETWIAARAVPLGLGMLNLRLWPTDSVDLGAHRHLIVCLFFSFQGCCGSLLVVATPHVNERWEQRFGINSSTTFYIWNIVHFHVFKISVCIHFRASCKMSGSGVIHSSSNGNPSEF